LETVVERFALEVLHDDVQGLGVDLTDLVDIDDAGVLDEVHGAGFVQEAGGDFTAAGDLGTENFDGDATANQIMLGLEDAAHAALANEPDEAIVSK
jgi:hypothetical protein